MKGHACPVPHSCQSQRGHSLVELMVSITLGMVLLSGLLVMYANANASAKINDRRTELLSNGRFAMQTLKTDLRAAGFKGFAWSTPNAPSTPLPPIGNECLQAGAPAGSFAANAGQAIWASQDSNPFAANCIPNAHYARGDVLVVRNVTAVATPERSESRLYLRSSYAASEVFAGGSGLACAAPLSARAAPFNLAPCLPGNPGVDLQDFQLEIHVYFIRRYTVSAGESPLLPALCRLILRSDGVMVEEVVASGIEDLRLQYARVLPDGRTQYMEANALQGTASSVVSTDWEEVNAVRIWLLARSPDPEPGYVNTTVYRLASTTFPRNPSGAIGDGYARQLLTTNVQLRNR